MHCKGDTRTLQRNHKNMKSNPNINLENIFGTVKDQKEVVISTLKKKISENICEIKSYQERPRIIKLRRKGNPYLEEWPVDQVVKTKNHFVTLEGHILMFFYVQMTEKKIVMFS